MSETIQLNIIPFLPPVQVAEFAFYTKKKEGFCPIHKDDLAGLLDDKFSRLELFELEYLYTDFEAPKEKAIVVEVDLRHSTYFAQHYYRHLIRQYFQNKADIVHKNFTKEIEVLFHFPQGDTAKYKTYNQFTLKVQHSRITDGPELVVSFDGKKKAYSKSLSEMINFPGEELNWLNCEGELIKYKYMEPHHKLKLDNTFPILSNTLKPLLGIPFDLPDFSNRYPKYKSVLDDFYNKYLNTAEFRSKLPISANGFYIADKALVSRINNTSNELLFGKGVGREPKTDMKNLGPYRPVPPPNNVKFFFIYQSNQRGYVKELYKYFTEGYIVEGYQYPAFPKMQNFIYQPFQIEENASITFNNLNEAVAIINTAIKNKNKLPDTRYMAIYISPESKLTVSPEQRDVYYRIKEILLQHQITSQVIYTANITNTNFRYFLPNIEIAMLAKLGGIPWRLNRATTNELIVGVGAFYSVSKKTKYVGSAFCFNNEGIFQGFDCFQANETDMLAGSIRKAVLKYVVDNEKADRLIIHFYKEISKKELQPIIGTLKKLNLDIPVIIVSINKTESKDLIGFDLSYPELMPYSGTMVKVGNTEYLLFNNTRYDETSTPSKKEFHFPIKISFTSSVEGLLEDGKLIEQLIDQVYQFSRMYWKSVSQQNLPVTIKYPEMVAQIYPYFTYDKLPDFGKENLWFL